MHSLRWYISVGFLMVGVGPLVFFGAQRISALFSTQNASIQQKHEPMAESLAQAIYGYLLDQTSALQSTASQVESDNDSGIPRLNDATFNPAHLNQELAAAHSAQPALLQLYVGNLKGRAVAAAPPAGVGVDYGDWNYVKDVLNPGRIGPKYSDVIRSKGDSSVAAVVIAVPILDTSRHLVGFLAGTVNLSEVQRLSTYSRIGVNGQAVVVDRRGRVIAHPRDDWRLEASCRDSNPDLFFPIGTTGLALDQIDAAKEVCEACPVSRPCLEFALASSRQSFRPFRKRTQFAHPLKRFRQPVRLPVGLVMEAHGPRLVACEQLLQHLGRAAIDRGVGDQRRVDVLVRRSYDTVAATPSDKVGDLVIGDLGQ